MTILASVNIANQLLLLKTCLTGLLTVPIDACFFIQHGRRDCQKKKSARSKLGDRIMKTTEASESQVPRDAIGGNHGNDADVVDVSCFGLHVPSEHWF